MATTRPSIRPLFILGLGLGMLLAVGVWIVRSSKPRPEPPPRPPNATTQPATRPLSPAVAPPKSYIELVRRAYPKLPTTQPLEESLDMRYAGHFVLREPVYLDVTRRLWITHADARPEDEVLPEAAQEHVILTRERPVYVHWMATETGHVPHLVCLNAGGDGYELVSAETRRPIGRGLDYDWARARYWEDRIAVPTSVGMSVFTIERRKVTESAGPALVGTGEEHGPVQITFCNGPLAWIPPTKVHAGSSGAVRHGKDGWVRLGPENGWPAGLVQLIPLLDGSVLQLLASGTGALKLSIVPLDPMPAAEVKRIEELIVQLSDPEEAKRRKAYDELTRYGPGLWPIAEKMMKDEPPETQARLRDLLRSKMSPLLGGMILVDGKLEVMNRYADGGVLFYARKGVAIPQGNQPPTIISPAWLTALAGDSIRLLNQDVVGNLDPTKHRLTPFGTEWIVTDNVHGPSRLLGGELVPLLRKEESEYSEFVGIAAGGRYVFRQPARTAGPATRATTAPSTGPATQAVEQEDEPTLIVDPRLPDARPRLPVWLIVYPNSTVGWDKNDWPAAKQESAFALGARDWRVVDLDKEPFYSREDQVPKIAGPTTRSQGSGQALPATRATTGPSTQSGAIEPDEKPILRDSEGNYYYDGRKSLKVLRTDGTLVAWGLPAIANGEGEVHLVRTQQGLLFLFNQPGRVVRIRPTPEGPEPFAVDAVFSRNIPSDQHLTRVWVDPFDRIVIAYDTNKLAILFPRGYIPRGVANLMPQDQQEEDF